MRATVRMPRQPRNRPGVTATMTATCGRAEQAQYRSRASTWVAALVVLMMTAVLTSGCGGPSTASAAGPPRGRLLSVADLPAGWSAVPAIPEGAQASVPCRLGLPANPKGYTYARAGFVEGTSLPSLSEVLATGPQAQQMWQNLARAMARCRTATFTTAGEKITATIRPLPFPRVASTSSAYVWAFTTRGSGSAPILSCSRPGVTRVISPTPTWDRPRWRQCRRSPPLRWRRRRPDRPPASPRSRSCPRRCGPPPHSWAPSPTAAPGTARPWS